MAEPELRVAVVGAGIGGLAAAVALSRAGFATTVYEQASALREVGVGLHLGSNGARILHRWGLAAELAAVAVRPVALEVRHWREGRTLARQPMGERWEAEFGAPYYTIHRADLHAILAAQVPPGRLRLNRRLAGFTDDGDRVTLTFDDGGHARADILVGADGVHSVVREAIAGPGDLVFSGVTAFRGLVPAGRVAALPADTLLVWPGPGPRLLCYPAGRGRLTVVGIVPDQSAGVESWSATGDAAHLAAAFDGWHADVTALTGAVPEVGRWSLFDREPLPAWSTDWCTLLGDAAHPMLPHHGQGAGQALEDAVALARCLADSPGPDGLRGYEALRLPHTRRVQLGSRGGGTLRMGPSGDDRAGGGSLGTLVGEAAWIQRYDVREALGVRPG